MISLLFPEWTEWKLFARAIYRSADTDVCRYRRKVIARRAPICFGDSMSLLDYWGKHGSSVKRRKVSGDDAQNPGQRKEDLPRLNDEHSIDPPSLKTFDSPATPLDGDIPVEDENQISNSQTELESSLPVIETDNQAIDEYETSHAGKDEPNLRQRMQDGSWQKGKSSIYVNAFNLALETVLNEEAHLFNEVEMEVFRQWKELSYESQYL